MLLHQGQKSLQMASLFLTMVAGCSAQHKSGPGFDISSVKPAQNPGSKGAIRRLAPGIVSVSAMTLTDMVKLFYHVQPYQIVGGPNWIDRDRFDVTGKDSTLIASGQNTSVDAFAAAIDADDDQMRILLKDRFQLELHREVRTLPILVLLIDQKRQFSEVPCSAKYTLQHGLIKGAIKTSSLASLLKAELGRPVRDSTGLQGCYDMGAHWTTDLNDETLPSIPTSLHDLGFHLEKSTGDVDVLIIDHAERPQPN